MLNFNQFRIFHSVAKNLSFTQAARELFITQPAVTAQMKLFEDYCGLKFFKKKGRGIYLTDEGKTLYAYAQKIFEYEKEIEGALEDMRHLKRGVLRIGTSKAYARYFMPFLISGFRHAHPQIKIHLNEGSSLDIIKSILRFENEIGIIARAEDYPQVCFIPFSQEELLLIIPPDHRWVGKESVSVRDVAREPIIMKEMGSGTRKIVNELFARYGCTANALMETSNTEFIKQLVQKGEGISFLVRESVALELKEKRLVTLPIIEESMLLDISIAYIKDQILSPPAQAFLAKLKKLANDEMPIRGLRTIIAERTQKGP